MSALELKVPPAALVLIVAAAMWLLAVYVPVLSFTLPWRTIVAVALAGAGFIITVAGLLAFRKAGTTVNPTKPGSASAVVASGVYRVSRNPMYAGFLLALTGWAAFLANALAFALLPVFVAYMNRYQITPEERALAARFGAEYAAYKASVRRWL